MKDFELEQIQKPIPSYNHAFKVRDNYDTPTILVEIVLPAVKAYAEKNKIKPKDLKILCPFDKPESKYVTVLEKAGYTVIHGHLDEGKDFFKYEYPDYDIVISNPPFSFKYDIFKKLIFEEKKPFMLLMNMMAINYNIIGELFNQAGTDIQFLIPDKKISFDGNTSSFCSGYVCYKMLEKTLFVHLPDNNTGKNYRGN